MKHPSEEIEWKNVTEVFIDAWIANPREIV